MSAIGGALAVLPWPAAAGAPGGRAAARGRQLARAGRRSRRHRGRDLDRERDHDAPQVRAAVRTGASGAIRAAATISLRRQRRRLDHRSAGRRSATAGTSPWSGRAPTLVRRPSSRSTSAPRAARSPATASRSPTVAPARCDRARGRRGADGRSTVLWTDTTLSQVRYAEYAPGEPDWSVDTRLRSSARTRARRSRRSSQRARRRRLAFRRRDRDRRARRRAAPRSAGSRRSRPSMTRCSRRSWSAGTATR